MGAAPSIWGPGPTPRSHWLFRSRIAVRASYDNGHRDLRRAKKLSELVEGQQCSDLACLWV